VEIDSLKIYICSVVILCLVGCSGGVKSARQELRSKDEIEAARISRRAAGVSAGDSSFLMGDFGGASISYLRGVDDTDEGIRMLAKRKLASVYEVQGNEKGALKLLSEMATEKGNSIDTEPANIVKMLYFADRLKDTSATSKLLDKAKIAQTRAHDVIHDPLIAPGGNSNLYYWLAMEADSAADSVLFNWAIQKAGTLSDQQWLQVATVLASSDSKRATEILKRIEPKLTGDDKNHQVATMQKIQETDDQKKEAPAKAQTPPADIEQIPYVAKFKTSGFWPTGKIPKFRIFKMRMGSAR
jgi:hypothetical protein